MTKTNVCKERPNSSFGGVCNEMALFAGSSPPCLRGSPFRLLWVTLPLLFWLFANLLQLQCLSHFPFSDEHVLVAKR